MNLFGINKDERQHKKKSNIQMSEENTKCKIQCIGFIVLFRAHSFKIFVAYYILSML